jgi:mRNA-degrading endonuclease RelE of RelBE toxin-antitoxin system
MVTQVTISPSFQQKMSKLDELIGDAIEEKLVSLGNYAVSISPVQTGAFVESWSLSPIGTRGHRYENSKSRPLKDNESAKAAGRSNIAADAETYKKQIVERGGAVLANRAPHAKDVEAKHATITRVRDRFR